MFNQGGWKKARQEQRLRDWFGYVPVYLITIDASFCENSNDHDFCALIEHELYHIGVERDEVGDIMYSDHTGLPKNHLAAHDVEEFIGVVKRRGANESQNQNAVRSVVKQMIMVQLGLIHSSC